MLLIYLNSKVHVTACKDTSLITTKPRSKANNMPEEAQVVVTGTVCVLHEDPSMFWRVRLEIGSWFTGYLTALSHSEFICLRIIRRDYYDSALSCLQSINNHGRGC